MKRLIIAFCFFSSVGCSSVVKGTLGKGNFKIYTTENCYDVSLDETKHVVNSYFPVVKRVCK